MEILRTPDALAAFRASHGTARRLAMVPTMGFLHEGHVSLLRGARRLVPSEHGTVLLTIFVNPTQFADNEDLGVYPRDEAGDLAKAEACGVDVAFCPTDPALLYPSRQTWVDVEGLSTGLCGGSRPRHFRGVCTIVAKLWGLARPDVAVFGEKDFQQLAILRRMHADLFLCGEIVSMPIVRGPDGLAMSSRNSKLSVQARAQALSIPALLAEVRRRFSEGQRTSAQLLDDATRQLQPGVVDYVEMVDAQDLSRVQTVVAPTLVAVAARFGGVRLIDNTVLRP
ncbi:MAG: pantoate--beta-alanine ligase [Nannocystaceae bacterium]|nr:pantoate--beta-alanine ligase [Nannocystaceae bacterium]